MNNNTKDKISRDFETLGITPDTSLDQVKQAYKDLVIVWHPDRYANNPRLQKKAEEKLKVINLAYEEVIDFISSGKKEKTEVKTSNETQFSANENTNYKSNKRKKTTNQYRKSNPKSEPKSTIVWRNVFLQIAIFFLIFLAMFIYEAFIKEEVEFKNTPLGRTLQNSEYK